MTWEAWITVGVVVVMVVALARSRVAADAILLSAAAFLSAMRLTSERFLAPRDVAAAFGNEGLVTVAVLFVVAAGLTHSGATARIGAPLFGQPKSLAVGQVRVMLPVVGVSAFLNNTTVVAMLLPVVKDWARKLRFDLSKLLMPLSYAAVLGGLCTLIGTSTNVIVSGQMVDAGMPALGMFTLTPVGVPIAIVGVLYVVVASRYLLPSRKSAGETLANPRQYSVELEVVRGSPLDGISIEKAGLRALPGLFLAEVQRGDALEPAVSPEFVLHGGDRLNFVGLVSSVADLLKVNGLAAVQEDGDEDLEVPTHDRVYVEAVVSGTSPMVRQGIREGRFRSRYGAAVVAVYREGEILKQKIGDIVLRAGDALLLEAPPRFLVEQRDRRDFFLVSALEGAVPVRHERGGVALLILGALVLSGALEPLFHVSILPFAFLAGAAMVMTGCCTMDQARKSIEWSVLFAIGASLVIASTLQSTGAASAAAELIGSVAGPLGPTGALAAIYLSTLLLTEMVTNNAAAALAFPVAFATANTMEVSALPFAVAVCMAASCGFATPTGYQTHLMVLGAGGYRFSDFLRMGVGLDLLCFAVAIFVIPMMFAF